MIGRIVSWRRFFEGLVATIVVTLVCGLGPGVLAQATWTRPTAISGGDDIDQLKLAVNARGDAIAVWTIRPQNNFNRGTGGTSYRFVIQAAFRQAGRGWQKPVMIGTAGGWSSSRANDLSSAFPVLSVVLDPNGRAIVAWFNPKRTPFRSGTVNAASRLANGRWQKPVVLATRVPPNGGPQVGLDRHGNALAVWTEHSGADCFANYWRACAVQTAVKPAGTPWRKPATVASLPRPLDPCANLGQPQLAVNARGDASASWIEQTSCLPPPALKSAFKPSGRSWSTPVQIGASDLAPSVALGPSGGAVAVWEGFISPTSCCSLQTASKPSSAPWTAATVLQTPGNRGGTGERVVLDQMGNATAVWATPAGLYGVFMESAYKPVGQSWGKPVRIGRATLPADTQLAGDMSGNVMVVWSSNPDEIGPTVQAAIRSTDGGWQHPVKIGRGHSPQVAVDAQGDAIAVWVDDVGLAPLVRAVAFTRTGAPAFTG